ncbi:hypothetical protein LGH70_12925 [Hymenobacter sp. BT635]|uniref:MABP domain-containing protein n=1 Tax=Hymenobacter nitidus TaxID=2880929 RepID=A0ABS8ADZ1_9BACT|nr:hypothetical protein [Hymenobacter nitidus]MCB2378496.1 hypothetical protein [Hymenobacter nitidus]
MKNLVKLSVAAAFVAAGMGGMLGCSKESAAPAPAATPETGVTTSMWTAFVQRVSEGVNSDPLGQYVAKSVQIPNEGTRPVRPKMNAEDRSWASIQSLLAATRGPDVPYIQPIEPTCDDYSYCGGGGGGGGGTPTVYSTFTSSEGQSMDGDPTDNPNNYIMDLELAKSSYASVAAQPGYFKLNADLNKGAGGKYIYLCFSRKQVDPHGYRNLCGSIACDKLAVTKFHAEAWTQAISGADPGPNYEHIWNPTGTSWPANMQYKQIDCNDGAGGKYIYCFLTKGPFPSSSSSPVRTPIREVGVISGNSSSIQPPSGWVRDNQDINDGAGGDYIYFCYKY